MGKIEWREMEGTNFHEAYIGEWLIGAYNDFSMKLCVCIIVCDCDTLEAAKAKAEELLSDWKAKAGLINVDEIYFCDKCGDTGDLERAYIPRYFTDTIKCDCRNNPLSIISLRAKQ